MTDFASLWDTRTRLLTGAPLTLKLASGSVALGAVLALLLTAMRMSPVAVLSWLARIYVFVFRGTPLLVQIFLIYYGLGQFRPTLQELGLWTFVREPYWCALAALTLNTAAYSNEIVRGGLLAQLSQLMRLRWVFEGYWGEKRESFQGLPIGNRV